jgi:putative ABC transport system substrate-binding protein
LVQRLRELGWVEDRNVAIEYRWAEGRTERLAELAAEFVRLKVDVIVTYATPPVIAAKQATAVIPIVFAAVNDSVGTGLWSRVWRGRAATSPVWRTRYRILLARNLNF